MNACLTYYSVNARVPQRVLVGERIDVAAFSINARWPSLRRKRHQCVPRFLSQSEVRAPCESSPSTASACLTTNTNHVLSSKTRQVRNRATGKAILTAIHVTLSEPCKPNSVQSRSSTALFYRSLGLVNIQHCNPIDQAKSDSI